MAAISRGSQHVKRRQRRPVLEGAHRSTSVRSPAPQLGSGVGAGAGRWWPRWGASRASPASSRMRAVRRSRPGGLRRPARAVNGWPAGDGPAWAPVVATPARFTAARCPGRRRDAARGPRTATVMPCPQPTSDQDPHEPYEVIHLGGEAAAIVLLSDLRRLRAVERRAARGEGISTTLHGRSRWDARSWVGCRPVGWLSCGWLRTRTRREGNRCPASTGIAHDVVSRQMHDTAVPPDG